MRHETEERKETPDLTFLTFVLNAMPKDSVIQFRSFAILAPWNSDHFIPLNAYDLSGMRGLVWEAGESINTGIRLANLVLPPEDPHWFRFRISDRANNMTDTWLLPRPPDSKNTKPALPALEAIH